MDVEGIKGGGMVVCCVAIVVVGIIDEMGTLVTRGIIKGVVEIGGISWGVVEVDGISGGVGDKVVKEEGEDLYDSRYFCTT